MDTVLYSIYKTQDNKFLVEDKNDGNVYKFNNYREIIDACPNPDRFQFANRERGTTPTNSKGKIDIYERAFPLEHKDHSQPLNNYGWYIAGSNPPHGSGSFFLIGHDLLEAIQKEMRW
jgi:hypothetical protein